MPRIIFMDPHKPPLSVQVRIVKNVYVKGRDTVCRVSVPFVPLSRFTESLKSVAVSRNTFYELSLRFVILFRTEKCRKIPKLSNCCQDRFFQSRGYILLILKILIWYVYVFTHLVNNFFSKPINETEIN